MSQSTLERVLLTTHYPEEADALGDRLAIIDHGLLVAEGSPQQLKREVAGDLANPTLDDVFLRRTGRRLRDDAA